MKSDRKKNMIRAEHSHPFFRCFFSRVHVHVHDDDDEDDNDDDKRG